MLDLYLSISHFWLLNDIVFNFKFHLFMVGIQEATDSCILTFVFCNHPIIAHQFQQTLFFQIFYINDSVICEQRQFYVFLPNLCIFYYFFFIALARISSITVMLKKNGERGYPCLVPDLLFFFSSFWPHFTGWVTSLAKD